MAMPSDPGGTFLRAVAATLLPGAVGWEAGKAWGKETPGSSWEPTVVIGEK